jgi:hypothetical protein
MAQDLPKFRYVSDVDKFVSEMAEEVRDLSQLVRKQQKVLSFLTRPQDWVAASMKIQAATFEEFNVTPPSASDQRKRKQALKKTIDKKLDRVVVPAIGKLKNQYGLAQDLYSKYQTLEAVEAQLDMQFPDARDLERAKGGITKLKQEIQAQLSEVLGFLNEVAEAHVPKSFQDYIDAIAREVEEHVHFEDSKTFLYVNVSEGGSLVFTSYIMLINALNEDGEAAPALYIAVQWNQGNFAKSGEEASVKIYLDHEFELPLKLAARSDGHDVESVGDAVKTLADMLEVENFSSSLGVIPLSFQMNLDPTELTKEMFSYRDYIQKVGVDPSTHTLRFTFRKVAGVDKSSVTKMATTLLLEVKQVVKKSRGTKIRMKPGKEGGQYYIDFIVTTVGQGNDLTQHDLEFLRERFDLNDTQIKKIARIFTQPKE